MANFSAISDDVSKARLAASALVDAWYGLDRVRDHLISTGYITDGSDGDFRPTDLWLTAVADPTQSEQSVLPGCAGKNAGYTPQMVCAAFNQQRLVLSLLIGMLDTAERPTAKPFQMFQVLL